MPWQPANLLYRYLLKVKNFYDRMLLHSAGTISNPSYLPVLYLDQNCFNLCKPAQLRQKTLSELFSVLHRHQIYPDPTDLCSALYLDTTGYFIVLALQPYAGQYFIDIKGSIVLYMYLKYGTTRHASLS